MVGGELVSTRSRVWDHLSGKVRGVRAAGDMFPPTFCFGLACFVHDFVPFPLSEGPSYLGVGPPLGKSEGKEGCGRWVSMDILFWFGVFRCTGRDFRRRAWDFYGTWLCGACAEIMLVGG